MGDFDPERVRRIERDVERLLKDLGAQHDAQEAMLEEVVRMFEARGAAEGLAPSLTSRVASRWRDPRCWSPVSSYAQVDWSACPMPEWPVQKLWVEVFLDRDEEPARLGLRCGVLVEGKAAVQRWYGQVLNVASELFGERHVDWRWRGSYGESWAYRDFLVEDRRGMVDGLVDDLVAWVSKVLPSIAQLKGR